MVPDADLAATANGIVAGVFAATGQTCMAGPRLIVHDELIALVAERAARIKLGDPNGLAGAVWTKDVHRAHRVAARIRAGSVWINAYRVVAPSVPFGGFKQSGLGRENGIHAIDEYLKEKAVWSSSPAAPAPPSPSADRPVRP